MPKYRRCLAALAFGVITACAHANVDSISRSGDIVGRIDWCGQGGIADIEVHIPGRSFAARTDADGGFRLSYVPAGEYTLAFRLASDNVGQRAGVRVAAKRVAQLGSLSLCRDEGACTTVYEPVCGDNGITYGNACEAGRAGTVIAYPGACQ